MHQNVQKTYIFTIFPYKWNSGTIGQKHVTLYHGMLPRVFGLEIAPLALSQHLAGMIKSLRLHFLSTLKWKLGVAEYLTDIYEYNISAGVFDRLYIKQYCSWHLLSIQPDQRIIIWLLQSKKGGHSCIVTAIQLTSHNTCPNYLVQVCWHKSINVTLQCLCTASLSSWWFFVIC